MLSENCTKEEKKRKKKQVTKWPNLSKSPKAQFKATSKDKENIKNGQEAVIGMTSNWCPQNKISLVSNTLTIIEKSQLQSSAGIEPRI